MDVLAALLWGFHNGHSGRCFPSYEAIAGLAGCARGAAAAGLKVLEFAGLLTWRHGITRIQTRERAFRRFGAATAARQLEKTPPGRCPRSRYRNGPI